jgi:hypothetical protein
MSTDLRESLEIPFPESDIEWRIARAGKSSNGKIWAMCLAYINSRAVMDRLDEVVGPCRWKDRYWREGDAIMCGLSIKVFDGEEYGEWIEKVDGAEATDIEPVKGGLSGALKRAAVKWGIGRYLYKLTEGFADISSDKAEGFEYANTKIKVNGKEEYISFYWRPPTLPKWALPEGYVSQGKSSNKVAAKTKEKQDALADRLAAQQAEKPKEEKKVSPLEVATELANKYGKKEPSLGPLPTSFDEEPEGSILPPMPGHVHEFLEDIKSKIAMATDAKEIIAAVNFANSKINLGKENKPGGVQIPEFLREQVRADIVAFKDEKKKELGLS